MRDNLRISHRLALTSACALLCWTFVACESDPVRVDKPIVQSDTLVPLNTGNEWRYEVETFDTLTAAITDTYFSTEHIYSDSVMNGQTWYSFGSPSIFYRNDSLGYKMIFADPDTSYLLYKYPARVGDRFVGFIEKGSEVIALNRAITVAAGQFNCVEYRSDAFSDLEPWTKSSVLSYVAPGVGIVLVETYNADGSRLRSRSALQSFTLIK
jgi:hypothetical protein